MGSRNVVGSRAAAFLLVPAALLTAAGCGGASAEDDVVPATSEPDTSGSSDGTPAASEGTQVVPAEPSSGGTSGVSIVVDGEQYSLSVADDITVGGTGTFFPSRCEPNSFGSGVFSVVATAADDTGARAEPAVTLALVLPHDGRGSAEIPPELGLSVEGDGPSTLALDYVLATDAGLAAVAGPPLEGDLGTWSVDGNRITGEVTVFETDHVRDFTTATFDITCPAP